MTKKYNVDGKDPQVILEGIKKRVTAQFVKLRAYEESQFQQSTMFETNRRSLFEEVELKRTASSCQLPRKLGHLLREYWGRVKSTMHDDVEWRKELEEKELKGVE